MNKLYSTTTLDKNVYTVHPQACRDNLSKQTLQADAQRYRHQGLACRVEGIPCRRALIIAEGVGLCNPRSSAVLPATPHYNSLSIPQYIPQYKV